VGVAVSNFEQTIASPLEILHRQDEAHDARRLNQLADEYEVVGIVVGLPMHVGGEEGQKAAEARRFGAWVGEATGRPVVFWDERYTTAIAEDMLGEAELTKAKRRKRLDKVAAQIMLQSYLDSAAGRRSGPR